MNLKYISEKERESIPAHDFAGPNRTFPIDSQAHVYAAAHLYGHAADPADVKKNIMRIARRKGYALPEGWAKEGGMEEGDMGGKTATPDIILSFGSSVKVMGNNKIGGHLVLFSTPFDPDTCDDYFDQDTDFDIEDGERRSGYYNHGQDIKIGNRKIGTGVLKKDEVGLWLEAQLAERDEYVDAILEMVKDGSLGLSSGALSHLVRREAKTKRVNRITHWPVGEWSLTPTPAEPRTTVLSLKSWAKSLAAKGANLGDCAENDATIAAIQALNQTLMGRLYSILYGYEEGDEGQEPSAALQVAALRPCFEEYTATAMRILEALITDEESEEAKSLLFSLTPRSKVASARDFEKFLRDAGFSRKDAVRATSHGYNSLRDAGETEPTPATRPVIDTNQQARTRKIERLFHRLEGLRLAT